MRTPQLDVALTRTVAVRPVPPGADLAAFRIVVREALTNVVRHAVGSTRVDVRVEYSDDEVVVQVDDDGHAATRGASDVSAGSGIAGCASGRTRSAVHLTPVRPEGGFHARARLPLQAADEAGADTRDADDEGAEVSSGTASNAAGKDGP